MDDIRIIKHILSFVGRNQYRFVAAINKGFKEAYLELFPENKTTHRNASTEKHARICWEEKEKPVDMILMKNIIIMKFIILINIIMVTKYHCVGPLPHMVACRL